MSTHAAELLSSLFPGFNGAHTRFKPDKSSSEQKITGRYVVFRSAPSLDVWQSHIDGLVGVGIIPLLDDGRSVLWAAIDVDDRSCDHQIIARKVRDFKLPLVVARSKSGGAHLYLFLDEASPAADVVKVLESYVQALCLNKSEIFPKQRQRFDLNDIGNALNMPYFGGDMTDRYAITADKNRLSIAEFYDEVNSKITSLADVPEIKEHATLFIDGPPCLQAIEQAGGFAIGHRNNALFNAFIYLQKRGCASKEKLVEINEKICEISVDDNEIDNIIKSASRKKYEYTCKSPPISSLCNRRLCLSRKYGVGIVATRSKVNKNADSTESDDHGRDDSDAGWPIVDEVTLHQSMDVGKERWYITIMDRRIKLRTDEISSQTALSRLFLTLFGRMPPTLTKKRFDAYLNDNVLSLINIVPPDEMESDSERFKYHVDRFIGQRATTANLDGLKTGIPYKEKGIVWFHSETLLNFLSISCADLAKKHVDLYAYLKEIGAIKKRFYFSDGTSLRVWGIKANTENKIPDPPDFSKIEEF